MISAIVAVDDNWGIGYNGDLLEHIPEDLKHFKELTTGHVVVMGRKTWDSLPVKPLPSRHHIVITHTEKPYIKDDAFFCDLDYIKDYSWNTLQKMSNDSMWFIIGGGQIYKELLPICDRVYVTKIYKDHENVDTYFPNLDESNEWAIADWSEMQVYNDEFNYVFFTYERV